MKAASLLLAAICLSLLTAGCGHKQTTVTVSPPPELPQETTAQSETTKPSPAKQGTRTSDISIGNASQRKPLLTQIGIASWYGTPYHNRRAANGERYDMDQMTAAHRTLPMNSIVRVTNLKTGHSAVVRITDRGPFVGERMLDLSLAAAKAVDVWRPGTAEVKMEVLETPAPINSGGKWAVQIGAFNTVQAATKMKQHLTSRYRSANVLQFAGPTGEWVRLRPQNDNREVAEQISRSITTSEGGVFLVRLD